MQETMQTIEHPKENDHDDAALPALPVPPSVSAHRGVLLVGLLRG
jgi:hypothetical protein